MSKFWPRVLSILFLLGCSAENETTAIQCEIPSPVSFSRHVKPVIVKNCADCHDASSKMIPTLRNRCFSWLSLVDQVIPEAPNGCPQWDLRERLINVHAGNSGNVCQCQSSYPNRVYVTPFDSRPTSSYLVLKLRAHNDPEVMAEMCRGPQGNLSAPMPTAAPISECEIRTIESWIDQGAVDN